MRTTLLCIPVLILGICAVSPAQNPALQEKLAAVKQSMAQNQAQLKQYAWTETTEISLKGEVKKREQKDCKYGPDGKVQKTPIGGGEQEAQQGGHRGRKGGLKGKIVENKVEDMKEYMDRVASLVHRYIPPNPQTMQESFQAGKATIDKASGSLIFTDYAKPGDKVTLSFDPAAKKLRSFQVATYLDDQKDVVSVVANFSSLPDGTNFLEQSVLDATGKKIQIKTVNFGHRKAGN